MREWSSGANAANILLAANRAASDGEVALWAAVQRLADSGHQVQRSLALDPRPDVQHVRERRLFTPPAPRLLRQRGFHRVKMPCQTLRGHTLRDQIVYILLIAAQHVIGMAQVIHGLQHDAQRRIALFERYGQPFVLAIGQP